MPPSISQAEWEVMRVLWAQGPSSAQDIIARLAGDVPWQPKTVKTLLNRLLKKQAIGHETRGREYIYKPLIEESACVRAETRSFLHRFFGGALTPMVAQLAGDQDLSKKDIDALRELLASLETQKTGARRRGREMGRNK
jgi:BlaI family penicillinase repressor